MLDFLAQKAVFDLLVYGALLFLFHYCVYRAPKLCLVIALLTVSKSVHTFSVGSDSFYSVFNLGLFGCLSLGLYLTRYSPNYLWLFTGLFVIKAIDVSLEPTLMHQGSLFYVWLISLDMIALLLLDKRQALVSWLAKQEWGGISETARQSEPKQRLVYQDIIIMAIYWGSVVTNLVMLGEDLIYRNTQWSPDFVYTTYPHVKLVLNFAELVLLFNIATGHAVNFVKRERVW